MRGQDLLFETLTFLALTATPPVGALANNDPLKAPEDWYESTTAMFYYCLSQKFNHPLCPAVNGTYRQEFTTMVALATTSAPAVLELSPFEKIKEPDGPLNSQNLFTANILLQLKRYPLMWLMSLKLAGPKPKEIPDRLWAHAQWLSGKVFFQMKKYREAMAMYDLAVDQLKTRSLFHQERAWVFFFNGKFDRALGSIVSAESPLVYGVPYFEKYFLQSLVERETCYWNSAFNTIEKGRAAFTDLKAMADKHPWVILCERENLGPLCEDLRGWYARYYEAEKLKSAKDLDLVEVELRDRGITKQSDKSLAKIVWPLNGEHWADELGHYSVPVPTQCS